MAKSLKLNTAEQLLNVDDIDAGSIAKINRTNEAQEVFAIEINNTTVQRAKVNYSALWMQYYDEAPVFTNDLRLLEYAA